MKLVILLSLIFSANVFSQSTKAKRAVIPESTSINQAVKNEKIKEEAKALEVPCDSKEDILKKLEAEKKAKAAEGKGFSLQGNKDAGCSL